jgi:hypothetical protein
LKLPNKQKKKSPNSLEKNELFTRKGLWITCYELGSEKCVRSTYFEEGDKMYPTRTSFQISIPLRQACISCGKPTAGRSFTPSGQKLIPFCLKCKENAIKEAIKKVYKP